MPSRTAGAVHVVGGERRAPARARVTRTQRRSQRLVRMRSPRRPPASWAARSASASATVFDHVGAHRVPAVDVDVQDHAPRQRPHLQRARAAAAVDQPRSGGLRQRQQLAPSPPRGARARRRGRRRPAPRSARSSPARRPRRRSRRRSRTMRAAFEAAAMTRRLLDHHRHQEVPIVDPKVERQPEGRP